MSKFTKNEVDYSKGTPEAHCGICEHYRHGLCIIVEGGIEPDYWCKKFEHGVRSTIIRAALYKGPNGPQKTDSEPKD
jgi:hypothetical protein